MPKGWTDSKGNKGTIYLWSELSEKQKAELREKETCFPKGSIDFDKKVLDKLTLKQREIISLFFLKYYKPKVKKLAKMLGITERAVYYRRASALKKLRGLMRK